MTDVAMTIEPEPHGHGRHMITVERGKAESVQVMILTDMEFSQLMVLGEDYSATLRTVHASFSDETGRPA